MMKRRFEGARRAELGAVATPLVAMVSLVVATLVFAVVGLSVGLTKGSPSKDEERVTTLERQLADAKDARAEAAETSQDVVTTTENYADLYGQMHSVGTEFAEVSSQMLDAGLAGNGEQYNSLLAQYDALGVQHNALTDDLEAAPKP